MGNDEDGRVREDVTDGALDELVGAGVHVGGALVHDNDPGGPGPAAPRPPAHGSVSFQVVRMEGEGARAAHGLALAQHRSRKAKELAFARGEIAAIFRDASVKLSVQTLDHRLCVCVCVC